MRIRSKISLGSEETYAGLIGMVAFQDAISASELLRPISGIIKYPLMGLILFTALYLSLNFKYKAKSWIYFIIAFALAINTVRLISNTAILYIVLLCFLSEEKNMIKSAKILLNIMGCLFAFHLVMFLISYFFSRISLNYLDWNGLIRYNIYFDHPNNAAKYFVFICALVEYLYADRIKIRYWFCLLVIMGGMYYFTHSEAVFMIAVLFIIRSVKNINYGKNIINAVAKYGMLINVAISVSCAMLITIPIISKLLLSLDEMGSRRFSNLFYAVQIYGTTLFGQRALFGSYQVVGGYTGIYADNLTVYCMTHLGIIYIILICILFFFGSFKMNLHEKVYICTFILFSLFENRIFGIEAYFALIIAANSCLSTKRMKQGDKILDSSLA